MKKQEILQIAREEKIKSLVELEKRGIDVEKIFKKDKKRFMKLRSILKYNQIKKL